MNKYFLAFVTLAIATLLVPTPLQPPQPNTFRASSAGALAEEFPFQYGFARFFKNDVIFYNQSGGGRGGRGFNVAAIAVCTGELIQPVQNFDTWGTRTTGEAMNAMISFLNGLPNGTLILIAVADEAGLVSSPESCTPLPFPWVEAGYQALESLGSLKIRQSCFRDSWSMIAIRGEGQAREEQLATALPANSQTTVTPTATIAPTSQSFIAAGGNGTVNVSAPTACPWSSTSNSSWLTVTAGAMGSGNGVMSYTVAANTGPLRSGSITIAGQTFTVMQGGGDGSCVTASISNTLTGAQVGSLMIPVTVSDLTGRGVISYDFTLMFDPNVLSPQIPAVDVTGTLSSAMTVTANTATPGKLTVSAFTPTPLTGAGTLINLKFNIVGSPATCSALTWVNFKFNEIDPCVNAVGGNFCVQPNFSITGTISYCITPTRKVSGAVLATSAPATTATTNSSGNYTLIGVNGGAVTVTPTKTGDVNGISSFDASQVAQHVAGLIVLDACRQVAADASNNGTLSSFDASLIAQYVAGIPNAASIVGTWKFSPANRPYPNLSSNQTGQDYDAILVGDVTGNWTPPLSNGFALRESRSKFDRIVAQSPISLAAVSGATGEIATIPITVSDLTGAGFVSYDLDIVFDKNTLRLTTPPVDTIGTLSAGMTITSNAAPGRIRISAFGVNPLNGLGTLLNLKFKIISRAAMPEALTLRSITFNEETQITVDK